MHTGNSQTNDINHNAINKSETLGHGGLAFRKGDEGQQGRDRTLNNLAPDDVADGDTAQAVVQPIIAGRAGEGSQGSIAAASSQASQASIAAIQSQGSIDFFDFDRKDIASQGSIASVAERAGQFAIASVSSQGSLDAVISTANQGSLTSQASFGSDIGLAGVASSASTASYASHGSISQSAATPAIAARPLVPLRPAHGSQASVGSVSSISPRPEVSQVQWKP